jgi:hypothetical protein
MTHTKTILLFAALALSTSSALAGALATDATAYIDGSLVQWSGSTHFVDVNLEGDVDWAVYAPNTFPGSFSGYSAPADKFIYTYQVFVTGSAPLSSLSVALEADADTIGTFSRDTFPDSLDVLGVTPSDVYIVYFPLPTTPQSANWDFNSPTMVTGESSMGLVFASPWGPKELDGLTLDDGEIAVVVPLPSPEAGNIPEPATLTLAGCGFGLLGLHAWRMRRRRRLG